MAAAEQEALEVPSSSPRRGLAALPRFSEARWRRPSAGVFVRIELR
jgi:hypothetical protein